MDVDLGATLMEFKTKLAPPMQHFADEFNELYSKKLWHQLTLKLQSFFLLPAAQPFLIPLFDSFIVHFEKNMNQLTFVTLATVAAKQFNGILFYTNKSVAFLTGIADKVREVKDAYLLAIVETCHYFLVEKNLIKTKEFIEISAALLEELPGIEPIVHSSYYRVCADYDKVMGNYGSYYKNALLYLACVDLKDFSDAQLLERAHDLCIAALLGEQVYNFGELLLHPILGHLKGTKFEWLQSLVSVFNCGDIRKFQELTGICNSHPVLASNAAFLSQKICLMSLIELVFKKTGQNRVISFQEISSTTLVPLNEVEFLIMKALALGLIKGFIDEIDQNVDISWVHPRVLDKNQIVSLMRNVSAWRVKAADALVRIEEQSPDLLVQ